MLTESVARDRLTNGEEPSAHASLAMPQRDGSGLAKAKEDPQTQLMPSRESLASLLSLDLSAETEAEEKLSDLIAGIRSNDRKAAADFARQRKRCQDLLFNQTLQRLVVLGSEQALWDKVNGLPNANSVALMTKHFNRGLETLRQELPACFPFYDRANDTLRLEFERLAEKGNIAARAVYALWPPLKDVGSTAGPVLPPEALRQWELRAMEFSLANLSAREPLGFKVFIESFATGALFTPGSPSTAAAFAIASARCGHTMVGRELESIRSLVRFSGYDPLPAPLVESILSSSEELQVYCNSDSWWPREKTSDYLEKL